MTDTELDVVVVMEPAGTNGDRHKMESDDWRRFVAETAGSISDPTFVRHPQGSLEAREMLE